jgi:serine/threonine protein kinase
VSTPDPNSPNDPLAASSPRAAGNKLAGCYALTRRLELGDGIEVWLAHDEVLGKDVSLHFIPEAVRKDSRALQELRLDVKRNRQLIHPNILRVYDLVEEAEWVAISMDAFEGESLAVRLDGQQGNGSKPDEIQAWVEQLAPTLDEAHKINVLHRDLSPSNIFLTASGKLLVSNFGISRTIRDAQARAGRGETANTAYGSPQLLEGKTPARTDDVYSLGAILYALITGKAPFSGKDLAAQVRAGVSPEMLAVLRNEKSGVAAHWQTIIAACLDKNPEARPQNAAEVARRLTAAASESSPAPAPAMVATSETAPQVVPAVAPAPIKRVVEPPVAENPAEPDAKSSTAAKPESGAAEQSAMPQPAERGSNLSAMVKPAERAADLPVVKPVERIAKEPKKDVETSKPAAPSTTPKTLERSRSGDFTPHLYPEESRFPVRSLAAAAAVIVVGALIYHFAASDKPSANSGAAEQGPEKTELRALTQSTPAADAPVVQTTLPQAEPPPPVAAEASASAKAIADKTAALLKAKEGVQAAEKAHGDLLKEQQVAEAGLAEAQKIIDEKTKAAGPLKKAAEQVLSQRKKLEEEQKAAEVAAVEAQKMAVEKARLAEESAKALAELEKKNLEMMAAPQQAELEIAALQKTLAEKQRVTTDGSKALAEAETAKQQQLAVVAEHEREIERLKSGDMEAQRQREAADAERSKLDRELAEMQRAFKERMADLESKRKMLEKPPSTPPSGMSPQTPPPTPTPATPPPTSLHGTPPAVSPVNLSKPATPEPVKVASLSATPAPSLIATPAPSATPGSNSLGMKFAPVGDVEFGIWQTRVKDFETFAKAVSLKSTSWKGPGFKQGEDHPVVNVSWQEAVAFCKWLTDKERKEKALSPSQFYRLPTDLEWSKAVGLPDEAGRTPEVRDMGVPDVYPWGNQWPPPPGAGNYTGEETGSDVAIKGYDDGFAWTSPVGSFPPNKLGLYDMGGNVWQWCMDTWNTDSKAKVLRGASWYNGALKLSLLSSCRVHAAPDSSTDNYGFRIVRASEAAKPGKK